MNSELQEFYISKTATWNRRFGRDTYYCVYSHKDKKFCRAQWIGASDKGNNYQKMLLIDLAEIEDIELEHINPLNKKFVDIPKHIFKVKIAGITPCGGSKFWQSSSCEKLLDIVRESGEAKFYITLSVNLL